MSRGNLQPSHHGQCFNSRRRKMVSKKSSRPSVPKKATAKRSAFTGKRASASTKATRVARPVAKSVPVKQSMLEVNQKSVYRGNDWWDWSVWVEASAESLDQIEYVEYKLHPTFPEPILRHTNRGEKFRLASSGWGEFTIAI